MVLKYRDKEISSLDDIQNLTAKNLREILRSYSDSTGWVKADLVLKVYALLMREVLNRRVRTTGEMKTILYKTIWRISALGWSTDFRHLPEMNFIQLYDYLVVSACKYRHIVLKGTHYTELKSYQFFFEGNVKKLESKFLKTKPTSGQPSYHRWRRRHTV